MKNKSKTSPKGGLRPPNPREPTACGHPYTSPEEGRRYKPFGDFVAKMGLPAWKTI